MPLDHAETLAGWTRFWAEAAPGRSAVIGADGTPVLTYGRFAAQCEALARGLAGLGVQKGDIVAMQLLNTAEFVSLYVAIGMCGGIVQPLHMSYRASDIEPILRHSGATIVITVPRVKDYRAAEEMLALRSRLGCLRTVVTVGADRVPGAHALAELAAEIEDARIRLAPPCADDTFVLLYTSGTTAQPKGVPATYRHFLTNARLSAGPLGITADSRLLSAAPFSHLYGLFTIHLALYAGAAVVALPAFAPESLVAALRRARPSALFAAPAHLAACLAQGLLDSDALSSLDFAMTSGSLCPVSVARAMQGLMPAGKFVQLWGMSELQAGSFARPEDPLHIRMTTAGRASPGMELRISGVDGAILPADREGELQVRGGSVFAGYLNNAEANSAAFTSDGWFRTGDLAVLDRQGNLRITGRIKELINRGGVKINPTDTELVLLQHPAVAQCALIPVPDRVLGEKICCVLHVRPDHPKPTLAELLDWLRQKAVSKLYWPERLELVEAMPLTPTRKIMKGQLARLIGSSLRPDEAAA